MILTFVSMALSAFNIIGNTPTAYVDISSQFEIATNAINISNNVATPIIFDAEVTYECTIIQDNEHYYNVYVDRIFFDMKRNNNVVYSTIVTVGADFWYSQFASGYTNVNFTYGNNNQNKLGYTLSLDISDNTYHTYYGVYGETISYPRIGSSPIYLTKEFDFSNLKSDLDNLFVSRTNVEYSQGYENGYTSGKNDGIKQGYSDGYADGFDEGINTDETAFMVFNGILNIALVPINFFLGIFNFEVLGINISGLVTSLLTLACTFIIVKMFMGGGNNDNS